MASASPSISQECTKEPDVSSQTSNSLTSTVFMTTVVFMPFITQTTTVRVTRWSTAPDAPPAANRHNARRLSTLPIGREVALASEPDTTVEAHRGQADEQIPGVYVEAAHRFGPGGQRVKRAS